jgi:transcriptional antiterminator RfaH
MKQWYLIQFKSHAHRTAMRNLQRQGFETFLPMQKVNRRMVHYSIGDLSPLFPGYMFVGVDEEAAPWRKINSTIGVLRLVCFNGTPKSIPLQIIRCLMSRCDGEGQLLQAETFTTGDNVDVLNGPFANFVATVEEIDTKQRVWTLINFMGQSIRMQSEQGNLRRKS